MDSVTGSQDGWIYTLNYETRTVKKNKRTHAHKSKESYPNFTSSGYWTLRNCTTLSAKFSRSTSVSLSLTVDSVSGIDNFVF